MRHPGLLVTVLLGVIVALSAGADTLTLKDGRKLEGRVVIEMNGTIMFEAVAADGSTSRGSYKPEDIQSLVRGTPVPPARSTTTTPPPARAGAEPPRTVDVLAGIPPELLEDPVPPPIVKYDGPTYYRIPLTGEVGSTFRADVLAQCLADALKRSPTVVVLEVDSPGGNIEEVSKLVELANDHRRKLRLVVLVRSALSAAAISALSVEEIYMRRPAVIGAATGYTLDSATGMPKDIGEKMASVWRATARSSAEVGNHPTALAEAMIDANIVLYKSMAGGKPVVVSSPAGGSVPSATLLKPRGKLLALTAREAVECGLAAGIADDMAELGTVLGYSGWTECKGIGVVLADLTQRRVAEYTKRMESLQDRFMLALNEASANRPASFDDYFVNASTGRLVPESQRKWEQRTNACLAALARAEQELVNATTLASKFPSLSTREELDALERSRQLLADLRRQIRNQARGN